MRFYNTSWRQFLFNQHVWFLHLNFLSSVLTLNRILFIHTFCIPIFFSISRLRTLSGGRRRGPDGHEEEGGERDVHAGDQEQVRARGEFPRVASVTATFFAGTSAERTGTFTREAISTSAGKVGSRGSWENALKSER